MSKRLLEAYKDYVEDNLERIERGGWTPVCFAEFTMSEESETYATKENDMDIHLYAMEIALLILNGYAANREEALDLLDLSEDAARELEELLHKHLNGRDHLLGQPRTKGG